MRCWLLERNGGAGYDEAAGFVVMAETAMQARQLAAAYRGPGVADPSDPLEPEWLDTAQTRCGVLAPEAWTPQVILRDFRAG